MTGFTPDADEALFEHEAPPPVSLADKFAVPPMSVLDRRAGEWQARKRRWMALGMQSELGRSAAAVGITADGRTDFLARLLRGEENNYSPLKADGVSIFDPVVCELAYRWHSLPGDEVLDPFAGGSVRGLVASILRRRYTGVDLSAEQVAANQSQAHLGTDVQPQWINGDSGRLDELLDPQHTYDMLLTCPPYGDLEQYSDDPADLSTMDHETFLRVQASVIRQATARLREDRFAVWVTSDIRDKRGAYRGLVASTIEQFAAAGLEYHNEAVLLDQVGTAAVRAERPFRSTRKLTRVHQLMLIFVKGDSRRATARLEQGGQA